MLLAARRGMTVAGYTSHGRARTQVLARRLGAAVLVPGRRLGRRLVLFGVEPVAVAAVPVHVPVTVIVVPVVAFGAAGVLLGRVGVGRRGARGRNRRRRRRVRLTALRRVALAAAGGVPAEERLRAERRLGRREVAAELALRRLHVGVPDLRRERGPRNVGAVVEPQHLRAVVGVADPDGGRQPRREAD